MIENIEFPRLIAGRFPNGQLDVHVTTVKQASIFPIIAATSANMVSPSIKTLHLKEEGGDSILPFRFSAQPLRGLEVHSAFIQIGGLLFLYDSLITNGVEVFLFQTRLYINGRSICLVWVNMKGDLPLLYVVEVDVDLMIRQAILKQYKDLGSIPKEYMPNDLCEQFENGVFQGDYMDELETYQNRMWFMQTVIPQTLLEVIMNMETSYI